MLIPQFSIRWLLAVTAVAAVIFSVVALGVRGEHWAASVSVGLLALAILVGFYGLLFFLVWLFSLAAGRHARSGGASPFAMAGAEAEIAAAATVLDEGGDTTAGNRGDCQ
ncbi:MAG: hypothetical protein GXY83_31160 [Rhodopirellula sp.]|nr:hypothetical protein [Rhodopirellula sp.]